MTALVFIEHDGKKINPVTLSTITATQELSDNIHGILIGYQLDKICEMAKSLPIEKLLILDDERYQYGLGENLSKVIAKYAIDYKYLLSSSSTTGKDLLPRVAALLDVEPISDIIKIENENTFQRPIYAGNAICTVKSHAKKHVVTVRASAFQPVKSDINNNNIEIQALNDIIEASHSCFVNNQLNKSERPTLTDAKIIISGGRGLQNAENFKLLEKLADHLNAAIGATRAAVDAGFVPNDYQVGQTGKIVAPELYIAIGISGAVQHLAGMKDSKIIVAINKDPEAPIFTVADYGIVGDLFDILPKLEQALITH